jgi:BlaI family penicillinase repressor
MGATIKITDAELEVMRVLWSEGKPITSTEIRDRLQGKSGWEKSTVLTFIRRLVEKGAVSCEKQERLQYAHLVSEKEYRDSRTRKLIDTLYDGSVRNLLVALCHHNGLTPEDREELQKFLEEELGGHE